MIFLVFQIIKRALIPDKLALLDSKTITLEYKTSVFNSKKAAFDKGKATYDEKFARFQEGMQKVNKTKEALAKYEAEGNTTAYDILFEEALAKNNEFMETHGVSVETFMNNARFNLIIGEKKLAASEIRLREGKQKLDEGQALLKDGSKRFAIGLDILWTIVNVLFVLGGMIGAICSKPLADFFGRRNSIIVHNIFSIIGAVLILAMYSYEHFAFVMLSRFFFGIQGGKKSRFCVIHDLSY